MKIPYPAKLPILIFSALFATMTVTSSLVKATGFTDLATCFTARKGDNNPIKELGECRLHFYSSAGGGTQINLLIRDKFKVAGQCPGESANFGLTGCKVNGLPGEIRIVGNDEYPAFCAWRHKDSISYCARPFNYKF